MNARPERVERYAAQAAEAFNVTPADVLGTSREPKSVKARRMVWANLRRDGFSFPQIGRWTGRHHSTVLDGLKAMEASA